MEYNERLDKVLGLGREGKYAEAQVELKDMLNESEVKKLEDENNIYYCFDYIELLIWLSKNKESKKIIAPKDNIAQIYYYLGYTSIDLKQYDEAIEYFNEALKWNPVKANILLERAAAFRFKGEIETFKTEIEKVYPYIYSSNLLAKYYRELGWYYSETGKWGIANALYTRSFQFEKTELAMNELKYIASKENRQPDFSTKDDIVKLFAEYNIGTDFNKETVDIIYHDYQHVMQEHKNINVAKYLSRVMYDITLNKSFVWRANIKDDTLGIQMTIPDDWKILKKEAYEKFGISANTVFVCSTFRNNNFNVSCDGKCKDEQFEDAYKLNIENIKKSGATILKEYTMRDKMNINSVFTEKEDDKGIHRILQNFFIANGYFFCAAWLVPNNIECDDLYRKETTSFEMESVLSVKAAESEGNSILSVVEEYKQKGLTENFVTKIKQYSKLVIPEGKTDDIFWVSIARETFEFLIILNLIEKDGFSISSVKEQCSSIENVRTFVKENIERLDENVMNMYATSIKNLTVEGNDKTLKSILDIITENI